jgi:hypothetical protein
MKNKLRKNRLENKFDSNIEFEDEYKGNKKLDFLVSSLFFIGICLFIWTLSLFQHTIMDVTILFAILLIPTFILTPLFYNKLNEIEGKKMAWYIHFLIHIAMTGSFLLFSVLSTNYYLAESQKSNFKFRIIKIGRLSSRKGKGVPYAVINYKGMEKQLEFRQSDSDKLDTAHFVNMEVKKGFLGFDVLEKFSVE